MKAVSPVAIVSGILVLCGLAATVNAQNSTNSFIPGGVSSVGLTNIVPDMLLWYNQTANHYTNGPVDVNAQEADLGNWEPYISVLGDSTFLIGANTFADDQNAPAAASASAPFQRFVVTFQPAAGGPPKIGEEFFTDAGAPYRGVINFSRENGNPQRVAGDKRVGATNFISAAETSAGQLTQFQSDSRWSSNAIYQADNRYVTVQSFSLDPGTLTQTLQSKALDAVYGSFVSSTPPSGAPQCSRTGGTAAGLDNGNFVVVIDDKTSYSDPAGEVTTFGIITPTGTVVRTNTLVDTKDIWDNVAAYKGGFAVRVHDGLFFYDNSGNLLHTNAVVESSGLSFGTGREDGSRIGSDIRSSYVYLAGQTPESGKSDPVNIAVWDTRTGQLVTTSQVSDVDTNAATIGRATVAVDALDHFCVAYEVRPTADFNTTQVAVRVGKLVGTNITYLTPSFFPFVNHDTNGTLGIITSTPSVAMTTSAICIAAKGTVNNNNNPAAGPNTAAETQMYTVINNPAAQSAGGGPAYAVGLNFGADEPNGLNQGGLKTNDLAGVPGLAQENWNNLSKTAGTNSSIVADVQGTSEPTSVTVTWSANNTWAAAAGTGRSSTGNIKFTGANQVLMNGYLDTGAPSTTSVTITGLPSQLTANGYDVVVYATGDTGGRGGGYRILDASTKAVLKDYLRVQAPTNAATFIEAPYNPSTNKVWGVGNYMVFSGLTAPNIIVQATTDAPYGFGSTMRAPINAIQIVAPASTTAQPYFLPVTRNADGTLTIQWNGGGTLQSATAITGPWQDVAGATNSYTVKPTGSALFGRIKK